MANKWFAGFLGFLNAPCAFIYLGRFRLAAIYFFALVLTYVFNSYFESVKAFIFFGPLVTIAAIVHAVRIAKNTDFSAGRKWYNYWWGVLLIPVSLFSIIFLIRAFIGEPYSIPSSSMSPSVEVGDHILVKKWGYGSYGTLGVSVVKLNVEKRVMLERGQVAVLIPPHIDVPFLDRIIGAPGDKIEFDNKKLIINGVPVKTEFLADNLVRETIGEHSYTVKYIDDRSNLRSGKWIVPDNHYFVMGDNRDNVSDGRIWGMVPAENIIGAMWLKW